MDLTIQDIIESVLKAIEQQGISLSKNECDQIKNNANKIIQDLMENYSKKKAEFSVIIPGDITKTSIRNRTVRRLIKTIKPCIQWDFELSNKTLILRDSYDIFRGDIGSLPISMTVDEDKRPYFYIIKETY